MVPITTGGHTTTEAVLIPRTVSIHATFAFDIS
jgi:hypothetical protein